MDIGAKDIDGIVAFAKEKAIDFAVVAPDDPLVLGAVDALEAIGVPCFGPNKNAAILEGSKVFSKNLMKKYNIPTAAYEVFDNAEDALAYLETAPIPTVIKADGLALGKGVIIAETREQAKAGVKTIMEDKVFGASGDHIVVEEFLTGPEVSIFLPTMEAMNKEGRTFKGCLYFGLMLTPNGPKVIEYNCRFGDPETQVVLPLLESDLLSIMQHIANGTLAEAEVKFSNKAACCVIMASEGYPGKYETGYEITLPADSSRIFVAGAKIKDGKLVTGGGRVLGVTEVADTLAEAVDKAYETVKTVSFANAYYRKDIGKKALAAEV